MPIALAMSACGGQRAIPSNAANAGSSSIQISNADAGGEAPADSTSILKLLTKDVTIGSTVDPTNGDTGPRGITVVQQNYSKLKKGHILVCNFDDSSGNAGKGTTIDQFDPAPSSKPSTFIQSSKIQGCDGDTLTSVDGVYATGLTGKMMVSITPGGQTKKIYGSPITQPIGDVDGPPLYPGGYSPDYIFIGNADTGAMDDISLGHYGGNKVREVVNGFDVNGGSGWKALGPSGLSYWCGAPSGSRQCKNRADVLYVADGACNAVVAISHATSLLETDEITVQRGCKSFKCKAKKFTCATLVKAGAPLDAPVAQTLLPNGNLIVANTGNNVLVEMTPTGQVLDTKVVDKSKTAGIFGLAAIGTTDSDTALYYTDTNTNTLHELEQ